MLWSYVSVYLNWLLAVTSNTIKLVGLFLDIRKTELELKESTTGAARGTENAYPTGAPVW